MKLRMLKGDPLYSEPSQLLVYRSFRSLPLLASSFASLLLCSSSLTVRLGLTASLVAWYQLAPYSILTSELLLELFALATVSFLEVAHMLEEVNRDFSISSISDENEASGCHASRWGLQTNGGPSPEFTRNLYLELLKMGGGLQFLNKKPWHPARFSNQEEVWKREQAKAAEERKAEELRKQLEEERKQNEFVQLAESAGHLR
jgi:hypothetical protein